MKAKNIWLRFGCFLTGYNYSILSGCSEVASKTVKKYTSAMIIIIMQWAFVGYVFTERYLRADVWGAIAGASVFVIIIIQVERQIILSVQNNKNVYIFRGIIALMMAVIGSIIIDQILFKEDIEQQKILLLDEKVNRVYPSKAEEIRKQIADLDTSINRKEFEVAQLNTDIAQNPTIIVTNTSSTTTPQTESVFDTITNSMVQRTKRVTSNTVSRESRPNPKIDQAYSMMNQVDYLRRQKASKDSLLLTLRPRIEEEIKSKVGFLDELNVMVRLLSDSWFAFLVWFIWFCLLMGLELFILMSKASGESTDYDELILHQMNSHKTKLKLLKSKYSELNKQVSTE